MLYTKFRGNRPIGSGDDFKGFTIYGRCGHLGHVNKLSFPIPLGLHINFNLIGQAVSENKIFENVDRRRRADAGSWLYYKLTL